MKVWRVGLVLVFFAGAICGCSKRQQETAPALSPAEKAAADGQEFLFNDDTDKAIEAYTKAIELDASQSPYYLNRGIAQKNKKQLELAIADFDKAIELDATLAAAYYHRGETYQLLGKTQEAQADLQRAESLAPAK